MTFPILLVLALSGSGARTDSERMAGRLNAPSLALVDAGERSAPVDLAGKYTRLIPCDADNCGKPTQEELK